MSRQLNPKAMNWATDREESFLAWAKGYDLFAFKVKLNGGMIE